MVACGVSCFLKFLFFVVANVEFTFDVSPPGACFSHLQNIKSLRRVVWFAYADYKSRFMARAKPQMGNTWEALLVEKRKIQRIVV